MISDHNPHRLLTARYYKGLAHLGFHFRLASMVADAVLPEVVDA